MWIKTLATRYLFVPWPATICIVISSNLLHYNINMTESTSPEPSILINEETLINDPNESSLPPLL